jgi:hypothetical protein
LSVVRPLPDLDGDGIGDLIFYQPQEGDDPDQDYSWPSESNSYKFDQQHQSIGPVVSGRTGEALWKYTGEFKEQPAPAKDHDFDFEHAGVALVAPPVIADVDGDGAPDVIGLFAREELGHRQGYPVEHRTEVWVVALSGRSGKEIWRWDPGPHVVEWGRGKYTGNDDKIKLKAFRYQLLLMPHAEHPSLLVRADRRAAVLALRDGSARLVPYIENSVVHVADDDKTAVLGRGILTDKTLYGAEIDSGDVCWEMEKQNREPWENDPRRYGPFQGHITPVFSRDRITAAKGHDSALTIFAREASGGEVVWRRSLLPGKTIGWPTDGPAARVRPALAIALGPDLDGDGMADVFVAVLLGAEFLNYPTGRPVMWTGVLSQADGRVLGQQLSLLPRSVPVPSYPRDSTTLFWLSGRPDEVPQLVLNCPVAAGRPAAAYLFDAGGRLRNVWPACDGVWAADFNADGFTDLYTVRGATRYGDAGRLIVIRGRPPELWRRPGVWRVDDARLPWASGASTKDCFVAPMPQGDIDGDGVPDVFVRESADDGGATSGGQRGQKKPGHLRAYSGATGAPLWQYSEEDRREFIAWRDAADGGRFKWVLPGVAARMVPDKTDPHYGNKEIDVIDKDKGDREPKYKVREVRDPGKPTHVLDGRTGAVLKEEDGGWRPPTDPWPSTRPDNHDRPCGPDFGPESLGCKLGWRWDSGKGGNENRGGEDDWTRHYDVGASDPSRAYCARLSPPAVLCVRAVRWDEPAKLEDLGFPPDQQICGLLPWAGLGAEGASRALFPALIGLGVVLTSALLRPRATVWLVTWLVGFPVIVGALLIPNGLPASNEYQAWLNIGGMWVFGAAVVGAVWAAGLAVPKARVSPRWGCLAAAPLLVLGVFGVDAWAWCFQSGRPLAWRSVEWVGPIELGVVVAWVVGFAFPKVRPLLRAAWLLGVPVLALGHLFVWSALHVPTEGPFDWSGWYLLWPYCYSCLEGGSLIVNPLTWVALWLLWRLTAPLRGARMFPAAPKAARP